MWLIRRQESIGVISLVFYCLPLLVSPPPVPNWETSITLSPNTHFMPEYPRPWLLSPGIAIHLCALPLLISPTTHPLLSTSLFQHPPPHAASPSRAIASLPGSICHPRLLRAAADTVKEKKKKQEKTLSGNMQKCEKVDAGCPGNGSEVISKHWWKSMSCARQAGTSVLRKIRKKGGGGKEEKGGLEGQRKMQRNRNQVFLLSEP